MASRYPTYKYADLDPAVESIRLLRLPPASDKTTSLSGSLEIHPLTNDAVPYAALSYTWGRNEDGDVSLSRSLRIGEHALYITENLHDALVQLRPKQGSSVLLWIDAVCICQQNVEERNAQVGLMAKIYARAAELIIWLGQERQDGADDTAAELLHAALLLSKRMNSAEAVDNDNLLASEMLSKLQVDRQPTAHSSSRLRRWLANAAATQRRPLEVFWLAMAPHTSAMAAQRDTPTLFGDIELHSKLLSSIESTMSRDPSPEHELRQSYAELIAIFTSCLQVLAALFRRRYFFRRWVVQEVYHSRSHPTLVRWAGHSMRLDEFLQSADSLIDLVQSHEQHRPHLAPESALAQREMCDWIKRSHKLLRIGRIRDVISTGRSVAYECFFQFQDLECQDPRDRLYAFASLSEGLSTIVPDYSLSTVAVYANFARSLAQYGEVTWLLQTAFMTNGRVDVLHRMDPLLPSWVPDFGSFIYQRFPSAAVPAVDALIPSLRPCPHLPRGRTQDQALCLSVWTIHPDPNYIATGVRYSDALRFASGERVEVYISPGVITWGDKVIGVMPHRRDFRSWEFYTLTLLPNSSDCFLLGRRLLVSCPDPQRLEDCIRSYRRRTIWMF